MDVKAKLGFLRGMLMHRQIGALAHMLQDGESVQAVTTGIADGDGGSTLLAATDRRLLAITDRGAALDMSSTLYRDVTSVFVSLGTLTKATAEIHTRAGVLVLERVIRKEWEAVADEIERRRAV